MTTPTLITSAIAYANGQPHIGHLYEILLTDMINRFTNVIKPTEMLTGTDEHGRKIQDTARALNITPKELCDKNSALFQNLYRQLGVFYTKFIRTTDQEHVDFVKESIDKASRYIYKDKYTSYYNVREEKFISEMEASLTDFKDPVTGVGYELSTEETYMFKLSLFKSVIKNNLHRVQGFNTDCFNDRLNNLHDLSISRLKNDLFDWGIEFPLDENHIVYVWFDALLNYISGGNSIFGITEYKSIHVIGKDIVWFHSVIYPSILVSLGLPLYENIYVHGFILDKNGNKMSKSLGNTVDPTDLLNKYPVEAIRFYFFMETNEDNDIHFNEENIVAYYNNILVKEFGNLLQRYYKLISNNDIVKYYEFKLSENIKEAIEKLDIPLLRIIFKMLVSTANKELTDKKPWKNDNMECLLSVGDKIFNAMTILKCVIPDKIMEINKVLGMPLGDFMLRDHFEIFYHFYEPVEKFQAFKLIN